MNEWEPVRARTVVYYLLLIAMLVVGAVWLFPYMVPPEAKGYFPGRD